MKTLRVCLAAGIAISTVMTIAQDKTAPSPKREWQILRDKSTNDCIIAGITAQHPQYPEQLGTYETHQQAKAALEKFKKEEDPTKAGFEKCTNK